MEQEKLFFGKKMIPFDYETELARDENACVVVKAYNGKPIKKAKSTDKDLEEK